MVREFVTELCKEYFTAKTVDRLMAQGIAVLAEAVGQEEALKIANSIERAKDKVKEIERNRNENLYKKRSGTMGGI